MAHVLCKWNILKYIRYAGGRYIKIHCNTGSRRCTMEAMLSGFGTVWFYEGGITNISSFAKVNKYYNLWYYHNEYVFTVLKPTHEVIFQPSNGGIHFHDTPHGEIVLVNMFQENMEGFTHRKIEGTKEVILGLSKVGYPSEVY